MHMPPALPCELLPWDTDFFRCRIGRVRGQDLVEEQAARIDDWSRSNNIDCLYFLAGPQNPTTVQTAERYDFHLVDVRLTFGRSLEPGSGCETQPTAFTIIRSAQ